jgi:septation ring formation regulator EzrA|tara:strand:- start:24 stop:272 length:249 start_codon:yes stop_codon:yes gene_type:complete
MLEMLEIIQKFEKMLETIGNDIIQIKTAVARIECRLEKVGTGCKRAFEQTKVVINQLHENQQLIGESLDTYGGVIEAASWNF